MKNTLSNQEIDELGEGVYSSFVKSQPLNSLCVDIEGLAEYLGMTIEYADFAEKDRERLGFLSNGIKGLAVRKNGRTETIVYPYKTIVLQQYLLNDHESGRKRFTIAHEISHYLLGKLEPGNAQASYRYEFDSEKEYSKTEFDGMFSVNEVFADRLAAAILMPKANIRKAIQRFAEGRNFTIYGTSIILPEDKIRMQIMANGIGVSFSALKIKLRQLGYIERKSIDELIESDLQEGDFSDEDIEYDRSKGQLLPEQIYLIHRSRREAERLQSRVVQCPVCKLKVAQITVDSTGIPKFKCQKCKFNDYMSLSYFRTMKQKKSEPVHFKVVSSGKRQKR